MQMATMAMMAQAVGIPTASSSNIGVNARLSNARRCSPAGASFSGRPASVLGLSVLGLGSGTMLRQKEVVVCAATEEKERASKETETETEEEKEKEKEKAIESEPDVEAVTRKFGLEAGLWKIFTSKDDTGEGSSTQGKKTNQAKELLARYGGAYLATSISLSIVSFTLCYVLVQSGVDVSSVLEKVGIHANETGEKVGTFALAYAAHKAASPIRFPPTVALTPIVAGWFGKKQSDDNKESK